MFLCKRFLQYSHVRAIIASLKALKKQKVLFHCMCGCSNLGCTCIVNAFTLNSAYNEVAFNENSAITKENLRTKYTYSPINTSALTKSRL